MSEHLLREATVVTLLSCTTFALTGFVIAMAFGFSPVDSIVIGTAMMFSSTIVGLKLLPTSALHHQRMGEIIVSILLLQDIIAVVALLLLDGMGEQGSPAVEILGMLILLPTIAAAAYFISKYVLSKLFQKFDQISEYIFLATVGWCLGIAELAHAVGLSHDYIAESLKPLRDFFLIMFFFGLGAGFDITAVQGIILPAASLALAAVIMKPLIFKLLLRREKEKAKMSGEIGVRLGQISEFSLLVAVSAMAAGVITDEASMVIQTATLLTFVVSSYWIVMRYPTPIAVDDKLRQD